MKTEYGLAGVDEAGRGPLAGPVFAAAVILFHPSKSLSGLNDSKQVLPEIRRNLYWEILKCGLVGVAKADEEEIERLNIYHASRLAMKRAVLNLTRTPDLLLIDGNARIELSLDQQTIVKGDGKSASIAAASIIAKVTRDAWMTHLHTLYPEYRFHEHKGYATPDHLRRLEKYGPSPVHRKDFAPVRRLSNSEIASLAMFARNDSGKSHLL